jgi:hypothetical protein
MPAQYVLDSSWSEQPVDYCWLDCASTDGWLKVLGVKWIVLCPYHATVLEAGCLFGSYAGAELPSDSVATEWPWMDREAA